MRLGLFDPSFFTRSDNKEHIWIHAVSVGEVSAVVTLIEKLLELFPQYKIICSTVTKTGYQLARNRLGERCMIIFAPLDFSWVVRKFIKAIKPKIYIATETEIWPNLYTTLDEKRVPIIQINGRISDKAFTGYQKVRWFTKRVLACVKLFCMQSPLDAERIRQLGADPEKVSIVGNLKFDVISKTVSVDKRDLGFQENENILIAGSTHPGEENIIIDVYHELKKDLVNLRLIIVPRHIERVPTVVQLIEKEGYHAIRFSEINQRKVDSQAIVVVDTIGHLQDLYKLATVVFIGKTLTVGGGQNMIESACLGKPTVVGPLTQNFKDAVSIFLRSKALIQVRDTKELKTAIQGLLRNPEQAKAMGDAARQTVENCRGATARTIDAISEVLAQGAG
jgi:3-deoxy-D-manno-octulosonic-acid transferase